jgi:hypothetical protein
MDSSKLSIKFYLDESSAKLNLADIVPVFHSWIQLHLIPDHQLIDVADYAHVIDGPGVVLVAHEANIYLDHLDGRLGLTYQRKQSIPGSFTDRLRSVFRAALEACQLLETNASLPGIKFRTNEADFKINDRLFAPNSAETFAKVKPELEKFARGLFGGDVKLEHRADEKRLFEVAIRTGTSANIASLLGKLESSQPAAA